MSPLAEIEQGIAAACESAAPAPDRARTLLALAEEVLEHWIRAAGAEPTSDTREGFRLLALHHQGTRGNPSFNACRETCREIVYHFNVIASGATLTEASRQVPMMAMLVKHLYLFVGGKLEQAGLGEFCCSARPLRSDAT